MGKDKLKNVQLTCNYSVYLFINYVYVQIEWFSISFGLFFGLFFNFFFWSKPKPKQLYSDQSQQTETMKWAIRIGSNVHCNQRKVQGNPHLQVAIGLFWFSSFTGQSQTQVTTNFIHTSPFKNTRSLVHCMICLHTGLCQELQQQVKIVSWLKTLLHNCICKENN